MTNVLSQNYHDKIFPIIYCLALQTQIMAILGSEHNVYTYIGGHYQLLC